MLGTIGYGNWLLVMAIGYWLWILLVPMVIDHWLWILAIDFYTKAIMAKVIACDYVYCYGHWLLAIALGHWLLVIASGHWLLIIAFVYWLLFLAIDY